MPTARQIITSALTYHLNRLSPGETLDADLSAAFDRIAHARLLDEVRRSLVAGARGQPQNF